MCRSAVNGSSVIAAMKNRFGCGVTFLTLYAACAVVARLLRRQKYIRADVVRCDGGNKA